MTYSHPIRETDRISAASGEPPRPVAQYLRMSSEHQRYSFANQKAAMEEYAAARNLVVVKSYLDPAKSGLTLRKRKGLQKLISDSVQGNATFKEVLVYDVIQADVIDRARALNVAFVEKPVTVETLRGFMSGADLTLRRSAIG